MMHIDTNPAGARASSPEPHTGPAGHGRIHTVLPDGSALLERNGEPFWQHLHVGARMAVLGPNPRNLSHMVIAIEGGIADAPGCATEAVLFSISDNGLAAMAAAMLAAAADLRDLREQMS